MPPRAVATCAQRANADVGRARAAGSDVLALHTMEMMTSAMTLYDSLGFACNPEYDFSPAPNVLVRLYRLTLTGA